MFYCIILVGHFRVDDMSWRNGFMNEMKKDVKNRKITNEEYRNALKKIFQSMDNRKLCYYYNYIIEYEKE